MRWLPIALLLVACTDESGRAAQELHGEVLMRPSNLLIAATLGLPILLVLLARAVDRCVTPRERPGAWR